MKTLLLITFILLTNVSQGQQLKGRVIDLNSGIPVPYASVGLIKDNRGTTTDLDGQFELDYLLNPIKDSLVISCVGYKTIKFSVGSDQGLIKVMLERNISPLKAVIVRKYSKKTIITGNGGNPTTTLFTSKSNSHTQVAQLFIAPSEKTRLESVSVPTEKRNKASRFRIRIYDYDSIHDQPGADLCDSVIEVYGRGINTVRLDKYHIMIPGKKFFVAVQWLFINENLEGRSSGANHDSYEYYRPGIRMIRLPDKGKSWRLHHDGYWRIWKEAHPITAIVTY